ncbi:hypothetical protein BJ322DRAFT_1092398 [Thelephora terrestris]|uniref:Fungal-type protein kinase domain-containing protein n=1 Tax=Thelephora terrestris TaxID=56493 RepID=A0A9P6H453_9AGAM|nr:hypothetical protein BJ322DRAFT_1092398 [Thelephora terrestris]
MSSSTPHKPTSKQMASNHISSPIFSSSHTPRSQAVLKSLMEDEIADQTFRFNSSKLAQILSPKQLKDGAVPSEGFYGIDQYHCTVDEKAFGNALNELVAKPPSFSSVTRAAEQACYESLAKFLTQIVKACHKALDKHKDNKIPKRPERWYHDLEFVVGTQMMDGIEGAAVLKPDIVGGKGISKSGGHHWWKPLAGQPACQVMLPVEVKNCWRKLVAQAATYARSLFDANPMRVFALILGFNHEKNQLRFLVFHRGGLAASEPCDLTEKDRFEDMARLFLTLATWRTAAEAGFITCGNDTTHLLPVNKHSQQHVRATVEKILFRSLCVRGRMTQVFLLRPESATPAGPETPEQKELRPSVQSVVGLRRSVRLAEKPEPTNTSQEKRKSTLSKVREQVKGERVQTVPSADLKSFTPFNFQCSDGSPILSDLTETVVLKTSWPSIDRRKNETDMFKDCGGHYGVMPHVSSYEVTGEDCEPISNFLFFPNEDEIKDHHWPLFDSPPPKTLDVRTYQQCIFNSCGKALTTAENPRQLTCGLRDCILGWLSVYLCGYLHRDPSLGNVLLAPGENKEGFKIPDVFLEHVSSLPNGPAEEIRQLLVKVQELVVSLGVSTQATAVITDGDLSIPWKTYWDVDRRSAKSGTPEFMSRALLDTPGEYLHSPVDDLESFFWVALWSVLFNKTSGEESGVEGPARQALTKNNKDLGIRQFGYLEGVEQRNQATQRFQAVIQDWWKKVEPLSEQWRREVFIKRPRDADAKYYLPHFHRFALRGVVDVLEVLEKHWKDGEIGWSSWSRP